MAVERRRSVPCRASCHSFQYTAAHLTVLPLSSASPQPTIILIGLPSARGGVDRGGRSRKGSQCRRAALGAGLMPKERGRSRRSRRPLRVPLRRGSFPRTFYRRSWAQGASEGGPRGLPGASRALFSPEIYLMSCKAPEKLLASCSEVPTALPLLPPWQSPEALLPQQQLLLLTSKADTGAPRARGHLRRWSAVAMATGGGWAPRGPAWAAVLGRLWTCSRFQRLVSVCCCTEAPPSVGLDLPAMCWPLPLLALQARCSGAAAQLGACRL